MDRGFRMRDSGRRIERAFIDLYVMTDLLADGDLSDLSSPLGCNDTLNLS